MLAQRPLRWCWFSLVCSAVVCAYLPIERPPELTVRASPAPMRRLGGATAQERARARSGSGLRATR